ncbi:MAG: histidine kinase [Hellea sp.]|nr:histidine kinase [Hellea sp.]
MIRDTPLSELGVNYPGKDPRGLNSLATASDCSISPVMEAKCHPRQAERLAALRSYNILDTPRESDFDDIVVLASKICKTPISVVNLIDADRQWFKAEIGIGARETPLETSICSHIILEQDFTMIEDTHTDPRTSDNELCTPADGLRFYAGALLKAENGLPIGTLCVLDTKPNKLDAYQQQALTVLAQRVMRELDLRRSLQAQKILQDEMDHRVKNSFSSIAAAIRLYKKEAQKSGDTDAVFDALHRHMDAVTAVHKAIYLSDDPAGVDLAAYMDGLTQRLAQSIAEPISITAKAPSRAVSTKIASTIGLIANEFTANTLKHGVVSVDDPRIEFDLSVADGELTLSCRNNIPTDNKVIKDSGIVKKPGIGERLMRASVAQHGGQLTQTQSPTGYRLDVSFMVGSA